jgi:hypothetical protein
MSPSSSGSKKNPKKETSVKQTASKQSFDPEDGVYMFLRNAD